MGSQGYQGSDASSYCTCTTSGSTANKLANCPGFTLREGQFILVQFFNKNIAINPTLNINSTGIKAMYCGSTRITGGDYWSDGEICIFIYDGNYYSIIGGALLSVQGLIG